MNAINPTQNRRPTAEAQQTLKEILAAKQHLSTWDTQFIQRVTPRINKSAALTRAEIIYFIEIWGRVTSK